MLHIFQGKIFIFPLPEEVVVKKILFLFPLFLVSSIAFPDLQMDCARWVIANEYTSVKIRAEVAQACSRKVSLDCAKWVIGEGEWSSVATRLEAVKACGEPACNCKCSEEVR